MIHEHNWSQNKVYGTINVERDHDLRDIFVGLIMCSWVKLYIVHIIVVTIFIINCRYLF